MIVMKKALSFLLLVASASLVSAQVRVGFQLDSTHLAYMTSDTSKLLSADVGLAGSAVPAQGLLPSGRQLFADL
jgi:hypothetical protein